MDHSLSEEILKILGYKENPFNTFFLKKKLQEHKFDISDFDNTLQNLLSRDKVKYTSSGLKIKRNDLKTLIAESDDIVKKYFLGDSIKELSKERGLSYVLVESQILSFLNDVEMNEAHIIDFQKYRMTSDQFTILYESDEETFRYLQLKYIPGKSNLIDIADDSSKTISFYERLNALITKSVVSNGKIIELTPISILSHLLEEHNHPITEKKLIKEYHNFLKDNSLTGLNHLSFGRNRLNSLYEKENNILYLGSSKLTFYPFLNKEISTLFEELNLSEYDGMYIHVQLIIKRNKELVKSYGIVDEHQLYFLLLKYRFYLYKYDAEFIKVPLISFGKADVYKQIDDLLAELGKILIKDFYLMFEERFGVPGQSLRSSHMQKYRKYVEDLEYYNYDTPKLNIEQLAQLDSVFEKNWYLITDAKSIFESKLGEQNCRKYFNAYNLDALGYNHTSEAIYLNKYRNLKLSIEDEIKNSDFLKLDSSIQNVNYVQSILNIFKRKLEIVPISSDEYITSNKLKSIGITKEGLNSYPSNFLVTQNKGKYFTLKYMRHVKYYHELEASGFEDIFYSALLESSPDLYYSKLINVPIFAYGDEYDKDDALESLASYVLGNEDSMDEYELSQKIFDIFGIDLENELRTSNSFYYNHKSMKIYRDKECFYEELRNHDTY